MSEDATYVPGIGSGPVQAGRGGVGGESSAKGAKADGGDERMRGTKG